MRYIQQYDASDCGAACVAMIASHFGRSLNVAEIRSVAGTDVMGTNMRGLLKSASFYGLRGIAVHGNRETITPEMSVPFIANLKFDLEGEMVDHYVVVKKVGKKKITVWNPDPHERKQKLSYDDFCSKWTGYALFFENQVKLAKSEKNDNLFFKFLPVFMPHKEILFYVLLSSLILMLFGLLSSFFYKYLFDEVIYSKGLKSLLSVSVAMFTLVLSQAAVEVVRSKLLFHFSYKTDLQLHFSYLAHIFTLPLSFFETRKSGEILSRLDDLDCIRNTISSVAISGVMDVLMLAIAAPFLCRINLSLFFIAFFAVILMSIVVALFSFLYRKNYSSLMSQNAEAQSFLIEALNGVPTVKALNAHKKVYEEYEKKKMKGVATSWKNSQLGVVQSFVSSLVNGVSSLLIMTLGCYCIISGKMTFGTLITFNSLLGYFTGPLFRLVNIQTDIQQALVAARRVGEILELKREFESDIDETKSDERKNLSIEKKLQSDIEFRDVTFAYGSRKAVYEHLNLVIKGGEWTAFVGPSGCGKSTLVKLILKFYQADKGSVSFGDIDIRDIDTEFLRSKIGYVPQDIFLFSGTIAENIALHHPNASIDEIITAAKKVGAHDFIQKLPKRYETVLGEGGAGLSGGEKQRLALARALLGEVDILILDEATSSLDTVSETEIHQVLKELKESSNVTVILIAHRLSTVQNCDTIYVMKDGKIEQAGNHKTLSSIDGLYKLMLQGKTA